MQLTVIVPVYNVEKYLEDCLQSLTTQTKEFDEIILVNDGSTDNSKKICEKYCRKYLYITLISQANKGLAAARNEGLKKATGDYVIFVDSDDYIREDSCAVLKEALRIKKAEILYYNADIQYDIVSSEKRDAFRHITAINTCYMNGIRYLDKTFPVNYTASSCVAAYSRNFLNNYSITFPEGIYFEDNFFSLKAISCAAKISGIKNSLYIRRCREDSIMTSKLTEKKCGDLVMNQKIMWEYLAKNLEWTEHRLLKIRFVSFGVLQTFFELEKYENKKLITCLRQELVDYYFRFHFSDFNSEHKQWEANLALLLLLKEVSYHLSINSELVQQYYGSETGMYSEMNRIESAIKQWWIDRMMSLPLQRKDMKIGIYGIGKHTKMFIDLYRQNIGEIQSKLFFVESSKTGKQNFMDNEVVIFEEISDDADYIIISSYIYQQEMYKNLLDQKIEKHRILSLYTGTSVCDLVMMKWVMDY